MHISICQFCLGLFCQHSLQYFDHFLNENGIKDSSIFTVAYVYIHFYSTLYMWFSVHVCVWDKDWKRVNRKTRREEQDFVRDAIFWFPYGGRGRGWMEEECRVLAKVSLLSMQNKGTVLVWKNPPFFYDIGVYSMTCVHTIWSVVYVYSYRQEIFDIFRILNLMAFSGPTANIK